MPLLPLRAAGPPAGQRPERAPGERRGQDSNLRGAFTHPADVRRSPYLSATPPRAAPFMSPERTKTFARVIDPCHGVIGPMRLGGRKLVLQPTPFEPMTSERFEQLLLGARDAANMHISSGVISGETGESVEDDHRRVDDHGDKWTLIHCQRRVH